MSERLGLFGLPEPTDAERDEFRALEARSPEVRNAVTRAMKLLEQPGEVTDEDRLEFREALRVLEYEINLARTRDFGRPTTGTIRVNNKDALRFNVNRPMQLEVDIELLKF